jgi:beta-lactamase class A
MDRRSMMGMMGLALISGGLAAPPRAVARPLRPRLDGWAAPALLEKISGFEASMPGGARIGFALWDSGRNIGLGYRLAKRFPMCSTFKIFLAGAILHAAQRGALMLSRPVAIKAEAILSNSPVSEAAVGRSLTLLELCEAAATRSDNTATNLLLDALGGTAAFTRFMRRLGDPVTRLDRYELIMSEATPGDLRDTTTPAAFLMALNAMLFGALLTPANQTQVRRWMQANQTGGSRLRAGLPAAWPVGDRTGAGGFGTNNVIAVLEPPGRAPILVAALITQTQASFDEACAVHAALGKEITGLI